MADAPATSANSSTLLTRFNLPAAVLIRQIHVDSPCFEEILTLRALAYAKAEAGAPDQFDDHSFHFAAISDGNVIGATRVTFRKHGALESESAYPHWILEQFAPVLGAASRMCILPGTRSSRHLAGSLASHAWSFGIRNGIRIDVTKARVDVIPYYLRMGYLFVRGSFFHFDKTRVDCALIAYPADPNHKGRFSPLFVDIDSPCDLSVPSLSGRFSPSYREVIEEYNQFRQRDAQAKSAGET